jgi:nucleotide sugar dehydrogenase
MAKFSHELGIDFWDVIRCASTKPFGFQPFFPGPGVGGHCIPIDPSYLSHRVQAKLGYPFRFVELAQEVNRSMPRYVADRVFRLLNRQGRAVQGSRVLLLGITYKPGIADQRESPAIPLAQLLEEMGAEVSFYDPFIEHWHVIGRSIRRVADVRAALRDADLVVHLQPHPDYDEAVLAEIDTKVLDTRGRFGLDHVERL